VQHPNISNKTELDQNPWVFFFLLLDSFCFQCKVTLVFYCDGLAVVEKINSFS